VPTTQIVDAAGNIWAINAGGVVLVNGVADTTTNSVVVLRYKGGLIYQQNKAGGWWSKTSPTAPWVTTSAPL
jgi:hypothetical protein